MFCLPAAPDSLGFGDESGRMNAEVAATASGRPILGSARDCDRGGRIAGARRFADDEFGTPAAYERFIGELQKTAWPTSFRSGAEPSTDIEKKEGP